jgi:hypothetical protein
VNGERVLERARAALSPEERFGAALLALSRDDDTEVRRLVDACPTRRVLSLTVEAGAHAGWKAAREHGVELHDRDLETITGEARQRAARLIDALEQDHQQALRDLSAWEAALDQLADHVGLEPGDLRAALGVPRQPTQDLPGPEREDVAALTGLFAHLRR